MRFHNVGLCTLSLIAAMAPSTVHAESYLCLAEAAGGVKFLDGKWKGTSFKTDEKYLISRRPDNPKQFTVTEVGKSYPQHRCDVRFLQDGSESKELVCGGLGFGMIISLADLRYTEIYSMGYIENDQSGDNTPFVSGGVCSKID